MNLNLSKLREIVEDRGVCRAAVHGVTKSLTQLSNWTTQQQDGMSKVENEWVDEWAYVIVVIQSLSCVRLFVTPWTAAQQASLSFTVSQSLLILLSIEFMMLCNYRSLCNPLLLPSIFLSLRVFSNESALHIRWPKYWSSSFSISPSNEYSGLISFRLTGWISL